MKNKGIDILLTIGLVVVVLLLLLDLGEIVILGDTMEVILYLVTAVFVLITFLRNNKGQAQ